MFSGNPPMRVAKPREAPLQTPEKGLSVVLGLCLLKVPEARDPLSVLKIRFEGDVFESDPLAKLDERDACGFEDVTQAVTKDS
jgi:hypothetical protein